MASTDGGDDDGAVSSPRAAGRGLADSPGAGDDDDDAPRVVSRSTSRSSAASARDALDADDDDDSRSSEGGGASDAHAVASSRGAAAARPTIHWKNGYTLDARGERKNLSPEELDKMRRERNRLHAKMTRDRKKVYVETLSRAVTDLEEENRQVRRALATQLNATVGEPGRYLGHLGLEHDDELILAPC